MKPRLEIPELPGRPTALQMAAFQRGDASRVIATVFEALEGFDNLASDRFPADDANDSTHMPMSPVFASRAKAGPVGCAAQGARVKLEYENSD